MASGLIIGFGAACVAVLLFAEYRARDWLRWLAKPAASAAFVALALASGGLGSVYGQLILAGLVFCMLGDILLIAKGRRLFLAGMGAFALGHLAYACAFAIIWAGFGGLAVIAGVAIALAMGAALRWLWPHLGAFRAPVAGYCLIIGVMTAMSFTTASPAGGAPYWLAASGAIGFAASDIAVARDQFVKPAFINRLWGLPLYYAAQMMLAASVSL
jgi:uncharacterized membrane protein YhhN